MIEIIRPVSRGPVRSVLLDFDGTLSLIREGWQEVMVSFMTGILLPLDKTQSEAELRNHVSEYVTRLTGKQTIYQMIQLSHEIAARGGVPEDPLIYKRQYHDRLWEQIEDRVQGLGSGKYRPEEWLLPGSVELLENLQERGISLFLASGTDEVFVKREAGLLGLARYFDHRIYGAQDQYKLFSKKMIIDRVLAEEGLRGTEFVAFGDGYVEIQNTKEVGGTAVGVASDERLRNGRIDEWKRQRLITAGADIIIPDFSEQESLVAYLTGERALLDN
jgi:beta-phosphoglucomutase-like phosphatase (HAD superfamily)